VVLDEFHERHLESDLALALLKRLQRTRPELRIVVMSATLDADPVAQYLGGRNRVAQKSPIVRSAGTLFELSIRHLPYSSKPLEVQVREAVELLIRESHSGDTLVFLPGAAEIRRAMRECEAVARSAGLLVLPLHGSLSPKEQDRALAPAAQRKLILSTNVAESSVTVEGVTAVIDSGLARVASYSPWSGLPTLHVARVSKAGAKQRAGRAGRTGPGRVLRLYSVEDFVRRPEQDAPEILRSDLSQLCLDLRAMGIANVNDVEWMDAPPVAAVERAEALLDRLGATKSVAKSFTNKGMAQRLASYPLPPRLSRILVEAMERGAGEDGCVAAALLGSGVQLEKNDLLSAMEQPRDFRLQQHVEQLRRIARPPKQRHQSDDALLMSVLAGFPDRVARLRSGNQVLLSTGGSAEIAGEPPRYEFMVAVDAEDRKDKPLPLIRMTARIEPEWLIELFPERVREQSGVVWNRAAERVDAVSTLQYDELVIQETRGAVPDKDAAAALLAQKAMEEGIERFVEQEALEEFHGRMEFAGFNAPDIPRALRELCEGLRSFAELKNAAADFLSVLEQAAGLEQTKPTRRLQEMAPARIRLQSGRQTKVHYERGKPPWIASRLQDFFGMRETPRIGPEHTPVVVHLLAPNQRAVQTTTDLAGFWERLYPQVRRELMRRYPRHSWPERP
jgi:ATP-dependent helicase HrpB